MSDNYQSVYDAVRSRISWPDVERIMRNAFDISHAVTMVQQEFINVAIEMQRPSVIFKPILSKDGDTWIALLGENLQEGVAGCGKSPAGAMWAFDKAFQRN
jgi:hypothetical protein